MTTVRSFILVLASLGFGLGCGDGDGDTCNHYTATVGVGGPICATSPGDNRCFPGDKCVDPATLDCVYVLSDKSKGCGDTYTAYVGAGGPICATGPGDNRCVAGDLCEDASKGVCKSSQ